MPRPLLQIVAALALLCVAATQHACADPALDQYAVAAAHYSQSRWALAIEEFERFLAIFPTNERANVARFFLAEALVQDRRLDDARDRFDEFLAADPTSPYATQAAFRAGQVSFLAGDLKQAEQRLKKFYSEHPGHSLNAYVLPYLGEIALANQQHDEAIEHYQRALAEHPHGRMQNECRLGLGKALSAAGRHGEAEKQLAALAASSHPLAHEAQYYLGVAYYAQSAYPQAISAFAAFEDRFADSPLRSRARLSRGQALLALSQYAAALESLEPLSHDPELGCEAQYRIGLANEALGDWERATAAYLAATLAPDDHPLAAEFYYHAGLALAHTGEPAIACLYFDVVGEQWPTSSLAEGAALEALRAAAASSAHGDVERRAKALQTGFADEKRSAIVRQILAQSRISRKKHDEAISLLEPACDEPSASNEDRYLLAAAYHGAGRHDDALKVIDAIDVDEDHPLHTRAKLLAATTYMAVDQNDEAIVELEWLLTNGTESDQETARSQLAVCYARVGRYADAERICEALEGTTTFATRRAVIEHVADAAMRNGEADVATRLFETLARSHSSDAAAKGLSGLAWLHYKAGNLDKAASAFAKVHQQYPDHRLATEAVLFEGRIYDQLGQTDAAIEKYRATIDNHPESAQAPLAQLALARLLDRIGKDDASAAEYERLASEYPDFEGRDAALYDLAWLYKNMGRTEQSCATFERLRNEAPESAYRPDATYRLAVAAFDQKDFDRAQALCEEVIAGDPSWAIQPYARGLLAQTAAAQRRWDDVIRALEGFTPGDADPSLARLAQFWKAEAHYRLENHDSARAEFDVLWADEACRDDAWAPTVRLRQAQLAVIAKDWQAAIDIVADAKSRWPSFNEAYEFDFVLGRVHSAKGEFDAARDAYNKVIHSPTGAKTESAAMAQWMIGESYFHQRDYSAAIREFLRVEILYAYPHWQAAALLEAAKCHEELGQWRAATQLYVRLLKNYPTTEFTAEASDRLRAAELESRRRPTTANR